MSEYPTTDKTYANTPRGVAQKIVDEYTDSIYRPNGKKDLVKLIEVGIKTYMKGK